MGILAWAFLGGIVGAVLMDVTETYASKVGITSGVNIALVGRWFLSLLRGQFAHANILGSKAFSREVEAGWAFHVLVGGGGVALMYPLFFQAAGLPFPNNHLVACYSAWLRHCCLGLFFCPLSAGAFSGGAGRRAPMPCLQARFPIFPMDSGLGLLSRWACMYSGLTISRSGR